MTFEELIKRKGFTQESLAKVMNKSKVTINGWCKGKNNPGCASIAKLAIVLDSSIEELVKTFSNKGGDEMGVNDKIKKYLEEHGISQTFIVNKTGIAQEKISNIINGKRNITAAELGKISKALNVSADIFLD